MKGMIVHEVNDGDSWVLAISIWCSVTLLNNIQSPTTRTYSCQMQSSLASWHCRVTTLRGPFRRSFVETRHVGNVNSKFSDTYDGWRTDRSHLTYIDLRPCLLHLQALQPITSSRQSSDFQLWIVDFLFHLSGFEVSQFRQFGRIPPRVGQISFLVLFDCKMWMENSVPEVKRGLWVIPEFCLWVYGNFPVSFLHHLSSEFQLCHPGSLRLLLFGGGGWGLVIQNFVSFETETQSPRPSLALRCTSFC